MFTEQTNDWDTGYTSSTESSAAIAAEFTLAPPSRQPVLEKKRVLEISFGTSTSSFVLDCFSGMEEADSIDEVMVNPWKNKSHSRESGPFDFGCEARLKTWMDILATKKPATHDYPPVPMAPQKKMKQEMLQIPGLTIERVYAPPFFDTKDYRCYWCPSEDIANQSIGEILKSTPAVIGVDVKFKPDSDIPSMIQIASRNLVVLVPMTGKLGPMRYQLMRLLFNEACPAVVGTDIKRKLTKLLGSDLKMPTARFCDLSDLEGFGMDLETTAREQEHDMTVDESPEVEETSEGAKTEKDKRAEIKRGREARRDAQKTTLLTKVFWTLLENDREGYETTSSDEEEALSKKEQVADFVRGKLQSCMTIIEESEDEYAEDEPEEKDDIETFVTLNDQIVRSLGLDDSSPEAEDLASFKSKMSIASTQGNQSMRSSPPAGSNPSSMRSGREGVFEPELMFDSGPPVEGTGFRMNFDRCIQPHPLSTTPSAAEVRDRIWTRTYGGGESDDEAVEDLDFGDRMKNFLFNQNQGRLAIVDEEVSY